MLWVQSYYIALDPKSECNVMRRCAMVLCTNNIDSAGMCCGNLVALTVSYCIFDGEEFLDSITQIIASKLAWRVSYIFRDRSH